MSKVYPIILSKRSLEEDGQNLFEALQNKSTSEILQKSYFLGDLTNEIPNPWLPCVDKTMEKSFLPDDPLKLCQNGHLKKMPVIIGHTEDEGKLEIH